MRKIKTQVIVCSVGACLLHMIAQHLAKRFLEQMSRGMRTADRLTVFRVHLGLHLVVHGERALGNCTDVHILAVFGLLHVRHGHHAVFAD